jgi:hypothetical protein
MCKIWLDMYAMFAYRLFLSVRNTRAYCVCVHSRMMYVGAWISVACIYRWIALTALLIARV